MKKVQPSGAQNKRKNRARDEEDSQQKRVLDAWIKRNKGEVWTEKVDVGIAEDSLDIESEDKTVSLESSFQDDNSISIE